MSAAPLCEAWLMPAPVGERFCIQHRPALQPAAESWVLVHGFAEELNKCRRMVALQARALAARGAAVMVVDLQGCGDSSGEFGDATWSAWVDDVVRAMDWMQRAHRAPMGLWGVRAGCLVAVQAAQRWKEPLNCLFWQPVVSGKTHLNQFTRLLAAANWSSGEADQGLAQQARAAWQLGRSYEIAGYDISADIARGLEAATLQPPPGVRRLGWFQVVAPGSPRPAEPDRNFNAWRAQCENTHWHAVEGPPFWSSQEIEVAPALIDATTRWVFAPSVANVAAELSQNGALHG